MNRIKLKILAVLSGLILILLNACHDEIEKYQRPEWLTGKIYTKMLEQPEISTFAHCVELIGYDKIIDASGSYTVFAPSNEAFNSYFQNHPKYNSVNDIPLEELDKIVKFHIIQNPWTKDQLRSIDIYGWIDTLNVFNNEPRGFKRETLLKEDNRKYGVLPNTERDGTVIITDTLQSDWYRRVATDSRKYAPIFYSEYFDISDLTTVDYEFYFNRPFEGGNNIYYAGAKITSDEIFAENGFIFLVDKVVSPFRNAYQIIEDKDGSNSYTKFFALVNEYPNFEYDETETNEQPGAELGLEVDSLFNLTFPDLTFDLANEETQPPAGIIGTDFSTVRYHHGMMAPTDQAFESFLNEFINTAEGWGSLEDVPAYIKKIIVNTHLSFSAVYPSRFKTGILTGDEDIIKLDDSQIIHKEFGSNSTFIGLNKAIVPKAFSSVTGPVYLQRDFSKIMYAIEKTRLLSALKQQNKNYVFFIEPDTKTSQDSSLIYDAFRNRFSAFKITKIPGGGGDPVYERFSLSVNDVRTLLLNHVATDQPKGLARKEFIPNLAGNYLIFNNETGEVKGTAATTEGYEGAEVVPEFPELIKSADNGNTYEIKNWFSFVNTPLYNTISIRFPNFHALLIKAGLALEKEYRYTFISNSEFYTVFVPTDAAIEEANLNSMPVGELKNTLLLHFVQGDMIFTDGNKEETYYETARVDEESTPFSTIYSKIYINPDVDVIKIKGNNGQDYTEINESENTNRLTTINKGDGTEVIKNTINNAVIHAIDKVLIYSEIDTK